MQRKLEYLSRDGAGQEHPGRLVTAISGQDHLYSRRVSASLAPTPSSATKEPFFALLRRAPGATDFSLFAHIAVNMQDVWQKSTYSSSLFFEEISLRRRRHRRKLGLAHLFTDLTRLWPDQGLPICYLTRPPGIVDNLGQAVLLHVQASLQKEAPDRDHSRSMDPGSVLLVSRCAPRPQGTARVHSTSCWIVTIARGT